MRFGNRTRFVILAIIRITYILPSFVAVVATAIAASYGKCLKTIDLKAVFISGKKNKLISTQTQSEWLPSGIRNSLTEGK